MTDSNLELLSQLIKVRNDADNMMARIMDRPATVGNIGEYIAADIFDITLAASGSQKGIDGYFNSGPLRGESVNIKYSSKNDGLLNMTLESPPDFYLVLTGPKTPPASSRGTTRPWVITSVFVFNHHELVSRLSVKIGIATSVRRHFWDEAEIYPNPNNGMLVLNPEQHSMLEMFGN